MDLLGLQGGHTFIKVLLSVKLNLSCAIYVYFSNIRWSSKEFGYANDDRYSQSACSSRTNSLEEGHCGCCYAICGASLTLRLFLHIIKLAEYVAFQITQLINK